MTYVPRTLWAIECNRCSTPFTEPDDDGDPVEVVFWTVDGPAVEPIALLLAAEQWVSVGGERHMCPPCARNEAADLVDRLAIELTHDPLPMDGGAS